MIWTENEINLLKDNYGKLKVTDISNNILPNRTANAIKIKAQYLHLKSDTGRLKCKYSFTENLFKKTTNASSYWAGFIAADGSVTDGNDKHKKFQLRIKLSSKDSSHLEKFKKFVSYTGPIYYKEKYSVLSMCHAKTMVNDLKLKFNIIPRKTLILEPPKVKNKQHKLSFIKGYIDGDGCISIEKPKIGNAKLRLSLVGTKNMLTWIKEEFDKLDDSFTKASVRKVLNSPIYEYHIAGKKAMNILEILHNIDSPELKRKWNKIDKFKELI